MIKKTTAIFFILLASIVLLAHAVVPHHHHKAEVCIEYSHCQTDSDVDKHADAENNHQHDGNHNSEFCSLNQSVMMPASSIRQELYINHYLLLDYQSFIVNSIIEGCIRSSLSSAYIPFINSSYSHFLNNALGLRVPPTV